jgi:hypothetical protein
MLFLHAAIALFLFGILLTLASFLLPVAAVLPYGEEAFRGYKPVSYSWGLFLAGYLFMAISLLNVTPHGGI